MDISRFFYGEGPQTQKVLASISWIHRTDFLRHDAAIKRVEILSQNIIHDGCINVRNPAEN